MTTKTIISDRKVISPKAFIRLHDLTIFFFLVFALTWPFMIADALGSHALLPFRLPLPLLLVMSYMPTLAAVIVTGLAGGRKGIRTLLQKFLIWRVKFGWYLAAIGGFALICLGALLLADRLAGSPGLRLLSEEAASSSGWGLVLNGVLLFVVSTLINGEELAWRGFALPRLQTRWNALASSLILGVVWTLFHAPLFFTLTGSSQAGSSFPAFLLGTLGLSVLFTWLYNHTFGSVLLAYLFHGSVNTWTRLFPIDHGGLLIEWSMTIMIWLVAAIVVGIYGPKNLARHSQRIQFNKQTDYADQNQI